MRYLVVLHEGEPSGGRSIVAEAPPRAPPHDLHITSGSAAVEGDLIITRIRFFKDDLDQDSRHELLQHLEDYRLGMIPLVVPVTLIRHYVRLLKVGYLADQVYLNPHPKELALRNHV